MSAHVAIGQLEDFPLRQSRAFSCCANGVNVEGFVVRQEVSLFAYLNRCPHTGATLNWNPDQFLTRTGDLIQCSLHGALFEITSGKCVAGPCVGDALYPVPLLLVDGQVFVDEKLFKPLG